MNLLDQIQSAARALGFVRMGICNADPFARGAHALERWLDADYQGEMAYMEAHPGRSDPRSLLEGARSVLVVALPYAAPRSNDLPLTGRVAAYAAGRDYHHVFREKLETLAADIERLVGKPVRARACVDSAPLLEREAGQRSGVGFIAKSSMLIAPGLGSFFLLGELVLDVELPTTQGQRTRCGSCTRCLDACPTSAFVDEFSLDARRCISYLTIEYRGVVPLELRPLMGQWVFGCDICQTVCPFNASKKPRPVAPELAGERTELDLGELLSIGSAAHRRLVAGTALRRAPRWQLMRNAAIALGNETQAQGRAIEILTAGLAQNRYPLVRGHIAWALGRLGATQVLFDHQDEDPYVRSEIEEALHPAS